MKKNKDRIVFDANVLVSALLFKKSKPRKAFDKALDVGELIISIPVLWELNKVLRRKKFNKYLLEMEKKVFLALLLNTEVYFFPHEEFTSWPASSARNGCSRNQSIYISFGHKKECIGFYSEFTP
ncbi:MAG: PIN domain-containing protein [Candidatus Thorarchaeota archaeon]|nr:PIN domain-containing protein [Candidatus Thorarchaeota archaeon]NIW13276.1 PIN domain-containing protein [Candidatus Thorarchaeota archaeon]